MSTIDALKAETDVPVIIADPLGNVIHINQIFEKTFGWKKDFLVGKMLSSIIPDRLKDAHHLGLSRFLVTGKPTLLNQNLKLSVLTMDGKELDAEHFIIAEKINGNWVFGAKISPLENTENKE
jgi:PAS domain S-box-containing protein